MSGFALSAATAIDGAVGTGTLRVGSRFGEAGAAALGGLLAMSNPAGGVLAVCTAATVGASGGRTAAEAVSGEAGTDVGAISAVESLTLAALVLGVGCSAFAGSIGGTASGDCGVDGGAEVEEVRWDTLKAVPVGAGSDEAGGARETRIVGARAGETEADGPGIVEPDTVKTGSTEPGTVETGTCVAEGVEVAGVGNCVRVGGMEDCAGTIGRECEISDAA